MGHNLSGRLGQAVKNTRMYAHTHTHTHTHCAHDRVCTLSKSHLIHLLNGKSNGFSPPPFFFVSFFLVHNMLLLYFSVAGTLVQPRTALAGFQVSLFLPPSLSLSLPSFLPSFLPSHLPVQSLHSSFSSNLFFMTSPLLLWAYARIFIFMP